MKVITTVFAIVLAVIFSTSFTLKPKPHLIVGNWDLIEKNENLLIKDTQEFSIETLAFSSDEFTSGFYLINKNSQQAKRESLNLAFRIYEHREEFENPVILFKNICDEKTRLVFSILKLDKGSLTLKFEKKSSSDNVDINNEILEFERTGGPAENMPDPKDALQLKTHAVE